MALAAAGAIAAQSGPMEIDVEALRHLSATPDGLSIHWIQPWWARGGERWSVTSSELARFWRANLDRFDPQIPRRLIVSPRTGRWDIGETENAIHAARRLNRLALTGRGPYDDWRAVPEGHVGAVVVETHGAAWDLHWNWPPRTLVADPDSGIRPASARYGRDSVHIGNGWAEYDITFTRELQRLFDGYGDDASNFNVVFDPAVDDRALDRMLWDEGSLPPAITRPVAILPLPFEQMAARLHPRLIDEITHNAPFDVALFNVLARSMSSMRNLASEAVLLVPLRRGFVEQMDGSRLVRRVAALLDELPVMIEYAGVSEVILPFDAPEFGLEAGPVDVRDLREAVETALRGDGLRFDSESQTGHSQWALEIATRDYRGGFGSAEDDLDDPGPPASFETLRREEDDPERPRSWRRSRFAARKKDATFLDLDDIFDGPSAAPTPAQSAEPEAEPTAEPSEEPELEQSAPEDGPPETPMEEAGDADGGGDEPQNRRDIDDLIREIGRLSIERRSDLSIPDAARDRFIERMREALDNPDSEAAQDLIRDIDLESAPGEEDGLLERMQELTRSKDAETPRYTTLAILPGLVFEGDALPEPLADTEPLKAREDYTLSLALKAKRTGIQEAADSTPRPTTLLRKGRETIKVYAVASCDQLGGAIFDDALQVIDWAFDQDTAPALFRFQMEDRIAPVPPPITIRLYSQSLHLLDIVHIRHDTEDGQTVRRLHWDELGVMPVAEADEGVDALAFHVSRQPGGFHVSAILSRGDMPELNLDPRHLIRERDLERLLEMAREFWTDKALTTFATKLSINKYKYARDALPGMLALGHRAWRTLFGTGIERDSQRLGTWISELDLAEGTVIRVTTDDDASDFVFPWQVMLHPGREDAAGLWGLRFPIEVTLKRGRNLAPPTQAAPRVGVIHDEAFDEHVDHPATLDAVFAARPEVGRMPLRTGEEVLTALATSPAMDLFYFFCHGSTGRSALALPDDLRRKLEAEIGSGTDWRRDLLQLVSSPSTDARIKTRTFTVSEDELDANLGAFQPLRPIVFLNMCHSANLLPGQSGGLTRVFLRFGCAAVLGTECPMNAHFADAFGGAVLKRLLQGMALGEAVRQSRIEFHEANNLLGFAYALYGHADAVLFPPTPPDQKEMS